MIDIIYDFDPREGRRVPTTIVYEDQVQPAEERENPWATGEPEKMEVDESRRLNSEDLTGGTLSLLAELRGIFREHAGLVTYQEIMEVARQRGMLKCPPDYPYHAWPPLTRVLNFMWRAGLIGKYRRGLWRGTVVYKAKTGRNHGVCYSLWP